MNENRRADIVLRYYRLVDAGNIPGLVRLFAETATYYRPGYPPLRGRRELHHFYANQRLIDFGRHEIDTVIVDGETAAVQGRFTGSLKDGTDVCVGFADFFSFDGDDRFQERRTYFEAEAV